jgi:hypothetical protein
LGKGETSQLVGESSGGFERLEGWVRVSPFLSIFLLFVVFLLLIGPLFLNHTLFSRYIACIKLSKVQTGTGLTVSEPRSNYCPTALPSDASYFGGPPTGTIGKDLPKEILRVERDWSTGEICQ